MIVGILGGGQLARMIALAGYPLGLNFRFLDQAKDACAFPLGEALHGHFDDFALLDTLSLGAQAVTYEFENVSLTGVDYLTQKTAVVPTSHALSVKQGRLQEKRLFVELKIPTAQFIAIETENDIELAAEKLGFPLVLKARSEGYDGNASLLCKMRKGLHPPAIGW